MTRERLYLETIETVLESSSKVLVDVEGGNNMMYLPLDKLMDGQVKKDGVPSRHLTPQELNEITNRVTEELNKRVTSARNTGRVSR